MKIIYWPILLLALLVGTAHSFTLDVPSTIKLQRDTAANWTAANPVLPLGTPGFEYDTNKLKIGDGTTAWNSLPYLAAGGSGLPEGGTVDQIIVRTADGYQWIDFEDHPGYISLMQAAGLNTFTFAPTLPSTYPVYITSTESNDYCFDVTGSNTNLSITGVFYSINSGSFDGNTATNTSGDEWCVATTFSVAGENTITLRAIDSHSTPNIADSGDYEVVLITEPVTVDLTTAVPE